MKAEAASTACNIWKSYNGMYVQKRENSSDIVDYSERVGHGGT